MCIWSIARVLIFISILRFIHFIRFHSYRNFIISNQMLINISSRENDPFIPIKIEIWNSIFRNSGYIFSNGKNYVTMEIHNYISFSIIWNILYIDLFILYIYIYLTRDIWNTLYSIISSRLRIQGILWNHWRNNIAKWSINIKCERLYNLDLLLNFRN